MKKLALILLFPIFSWAQSHQGISGEWSGRIQVLGGSAQIHYDLVQIGLTVEGYAISKSLNGHDSSKVQLKGVVKGTEIHLRATKFIYKVGVACLAGTELTWSREGDVQFLRGKWSGDFSLKTCPPGTFGKIEVQKIKQFETQLEPTPDLALVDTDDYEGNALLTELQKRKYYALIVGINEYQDEGIQDLDNPVKDAIALKNVLKEFYSFTDENIKFLTNPNRTQIIEAFDALASSITDKDQLLIFYAGHGIWDEQLNQGFWLPSDAAKNSKAQWLSNSTIRDYIGGIHSKHTLLITDACFSGSIFKERGVSFANSKAVLELYRLPSRKAMTSGTLKTVPDQSVFIKYLVKNLLNNDQPLISAEEIFRNFKIAVINNSQNGQVPQYGPIGQVGDEGGDFIFLRSK